MSVDYRQEEGYLVEFPAGIQEKIRTEEEEVFQKSSATKRWRM